MVVSLSSGNIYNNFPVKIYMYMVSLFDSISQEECLYMCNVLYVDAISTWFCFPSAAKLYLDGHLFYVV